MKPGRLRKFYRPWVDPFKVTKRISELNYEIIDQKGKKQFVHINRLKITDNPELWKPKTKQKSEKKLLRTQTENTSEAEDSVWKPRSLPPACADCTVNNGERENPPGQSPIHPITDTPLLITAILHTTLLTHLDLDANFSLPGTNLQLLDLELEYYLRPI